MDIFRFNKLHYDLQEQMNAAEAVGRRLKNDTLILGTGPEKSSNSLRLNAFCIRRQLHGNFDLSSTVSIRI